jgi:pimeloyl-ACP methyl ester carboxylesterase
VVRYAPRSERRRRWRLVASFVLAVVILLHLGGGFYFADQLRIDALVPETGDQAFDITVTEVGAGTIGLRAVEGEDSDLTAAGVVGIDWGTGYGQLGDVVSEGTDGSVVRSMTRTDGQPPEVGMMADLEGAAFPGNPDRAFGLSYTEVQFDTPLGAMNAWEILAPSSLWVIHVHGLGAPRSEALRAVRAIAEAGHPQLVINYRNDPGEPADPSGYYLYGQSEWEDVAGAVAYAVERGAERVVLVGYSTGAAHIVSYLYRSPDSHVVAAVFDSPNLDFEETVNLGASQRTLPLIPLPLPGTLVWTAKRLASIRFGVNWGAIDYVSRAELLNVPVLVFHGTDDDTVPLSSSQEFFEARPDLVRLVIVPGAGHVRSWNISPEAYERRLTEFLTEFAPTS